MKTKITFAALLLGGVLFAGSAMADSTMAPNTMSTTPPSAGGMMAHKPHKPLKPTTNAMGGTMGTHPMGNAMAPAGNAMAPANTMGGSH